MRNEVSVRGCSRRGFRAVSWHEDEEQDEEEGKDSCDEAIQFRMLRAPGSDANHYPKNDAENNREGAITDTKHLGVVLGCSNACKQPQEQYDLEHLNLLSNAVVLFDGSLLPYQPALLILNKLR